MRLRHISAIVGRIHLQGLVEDLFTLSRAEVGKLTLRCEPTDVGILVRRIVETAAPLVWQASRIEVVAEVSCELPSLLVDANRLEQVLQNLLHNAVRHTSPGGIVAVVVMAEPEVVVLQVKDTGEGIIDIPFTPTYNLIYPYEDIAAELRRP